MYWFYLSSQIGWWGWCAFIGWQRELSIFISLFCTCIYNKNCLDYVFIYHIIYIFFMFRFFTFRKNCLCFIFLFLLFHVTCFSFQHFFEIFYYYLWKVLELLTYIQSRLDGETHWKCNVVLAGDTLYLWAFLFVIIIVMFGGGDDKNNNNNYNINSTTTLYWWCSVLISLLRDWSTLYY